MQFTPISTIFDGQEILYRILGQFIQFILTKFQKTVADVLDNRQRALTFEPMDRLFKMLDRGVAFYICRVLLSCLIIQKNLRWRGCYQFEHQLKLLMFEPLLHNVSYQMEKLIVLSNMISRRFFVNLNNPSPKYYNLSCHPIVM